MRILRPGVKGDDMWWMDLGDDFMQCLFSLNEYTNDTFSLLYVLLYIFYNNISILQTHLTIVVYVILCTLEGLTAFKLEF